MVDGLLHASCHQCKTTKVHHLVLACHAKADPLRKARQCRKRYCQTCLHRTYGMSLQAMSKRELDEWICPACHDACCCAACKRTKEKAYAEQMIKMTTQAAMIQQSAAAAHHQQQGAGVGLPQLAAAQRVGEQGAQAELQRVKSLTDALITATGAAPSQEGDDAATAALHYQLQQLQHLHQMQQLQQTLSLLQALSNKAGAPAMPPAFGAMPDAFSAPVSSVTSPVHRGATGLGLHVGALGQGEVSAVDDTFGHQLHLRIATLRHQQEQERGEKVEPIDVHLPVLSTVPTSAASTPNEAPLIPLTLPVLPRAASHPIRSVPVSPTHSNAPAISMEGEDGGEVDYGAIANKLMTAASLATRIFQEQRSGKQQLMYQQQCRLQQQQQQHHQAGMYEGHQQQGPPVVPLSLSALSSGPSSVSAHAAFLSQQRGGELEMYHHDSPHSSSRASLPSHLPYSDVDYSLKVSDRDDLHRLQMSVLQERQRAQLQQLLHTQERIRMHAKDTTSAVEHSSAVMALSAPSPPPKRQCHSLGPSPAAPSDAMQQLQAKVEALQMEQRRLALEEERAMREQSAMVDGPQPSSSDPSDLFNDNLSPANFMSMSDPWGKLPPLSGQLPGDADRSLSVSSRWPLEELEEEEAHLMRRVI